MMAHTRLGRAAHLAASAVLVAGLLGLSAVRPAYAQTISVTTTAEAPGGSGDCTLGEAIQAANTDLAVDACTAGFGNDLIVLAPGATYTLTTAAADESAFVINSSLTLNGNGARLAHDPLGGALRFITMTASSSLTLTNLSLVGGLALGKAGKGCSFACAGGGPGGNALGGAINSLGGALVLDGVTFVNNRAQGGHGGSGFTGGSSDGGAGGSSNGGAIYSTGLVTLVGVSSTFSSNQALGGAGGNGGNSGGQSGSGGNGGAGAIYASQLFATSAAMTLNDNLAQGGDGGSGPVSGAAGGAGGGAAGGALDGSYANLVGANIFNNRAVGGNAGGGPPPNPNQTFGGSVMGGSLLLGSVTLVDSRLISNTAQGGAGPRGGRAEGGGLFAFTGAPTAQLEHSVVQSNTAQGGAGSAANATGGLASGGGLFILGGPLRVDRSALVGNSVQAGVDPNTSTVAPAQGGGLYTMGTAAITNTTIALNRAGHGGGLVDDGPYNVALTHATVYGNSANTAGGLAAFSAAIYLRNTIVADSTGGTCSGTIYAFDANLEYPDADCGIFTVADPRLGEVADHGGQTLTALPAAGSPALDAADLAYCPATDQRGQPRPIGAGCDLGALERWLDLFLPLLSR